MKSKIKSLKEFVLFVIAIICFAFISFAALPIQYHSLNELMPGAVFIDHATDYGGDEYVFLRNHTDGDEAFLNILVENGTAVYGVSVGKSGNTIEGYSSNANGGVGVFGKSEGINGVGVFGEENGGSYTGVMGESRAYNGTGVYGIASNTGSTYAAIGVEGITSSGKGIGVKGIANNTAGINYGVYGESKSTAVGSTGVYAYSSGSSGSTYGVYGLTNDSNVNSRGIYGKGNTGVYGESTLADGRGVYGVATGTSGNGIMGYSTSTHSVYGEVNSPNSFAVYAKSDDGNVLFGALFVQGYEVVRGLTKDNCVNMLTTDSSTYVINQWKLVNIPTTCLGSICEIEVIGYDVSAGNYYNLDTAVYFQETDDDYTAWIGSNANSANNGYQNGGGSYNIISRTHRCELWLDCPSGTCGSNQINARQWTLNSYDSNVRCYLRVCN